MEEILRQLEEISNLSDKDCEEIEEDYIEHRKEVNEFLKRMGYEN